MSYSNHNGHYKPNNRLNGSPAQPLSDADIAKSLELLRPDGVVEEDSVHLDDVSDADDFDDNVTYVDTGRTSALFNIVDPPRSDRRVVDEETIAFNKVTADSDNDEEYLAVQRLALYGDDDDVTVTSDEERDIINEIRDEMTKNVIDSDMNNAQLDVYRNPSRSASSHQTGEAGEPPDDLGNMEPKLKAAILKMRKLDRILERKMEQEKKVKRERILMTRRLRREIESMQLECKDNMTAEEKRNTEKYLSLALPPSHNAGIHIDDDDDCDDDSAADDGTSPSPTHLPLFQTQPPELDKNSKQSMNASSRNGSARRSASGMSGATNSTSSTGRRTTTSPGKGGQSYRHSARSNASSSTSSGSVNGRSSTRNGKKNKSRQNKDFVLRNIELASDAQNTIAMTDDEKKRVEDLLADLDALPEITEENEVNESTDNPYQLALVTRDNDGFWPSSEERHRLEEIDTRLKMLLPADEFESLCQTPTSSTGLMAIEPFPHSSRSALSILSDTSDVMTPALLDVDSVGESMLRETRIDREVKTRLKQIEDELARLSTFTVAENGSTRLTDDQLNELLDECVRSMSRTASRATNRSESSLATASRPTSSRSILYENPPHLEESVLRQLLADARGNSSESPTHENNSDRDSPQSSSSNNRLGDFQLEPISDRRPVSHDEIRNFRQEIADVTPRSAGPLVRRNSSSLLQSRSSDRIQDNDREPSPKRRPFLPSIDFTGNLCTQRPASDTRLNNECRHSNEAGTGRMSCRPAAITVWNSLSVSPSPPPAETLQAAQRSPAPPPSDRSRPNSRPRKSSDCI